MKWYEHRAALDNDASTYLNVRWCGECGCEVMPAALEDEDRCEICNALTDEDFGDYVDRTLNAFGKG